MNAPDPDRYDALATRCERLETTLSATQERLTRVEAAGMAQAEATTRYIAADTQQTVEIAEVRATTTALVKMLTGPPSLDTRIAELHGLVGKPSSTLNLPGVNINLPDPKTLGEYGDGLKKWGFRAVATAFALVALLKMNACDSERTLDRMERMMRRDSTARVENLRDVQAAAEADRERNTERVHEALPTDPDSTQ